MSRQREAEVGAIEAIAVERAGPRREQVARAVDRTDLLRRKTALQQGANGDAGRLGDVQEIQRSVGGHGDASEQRGAIVVKHPWPGARRAATLNVFYPEDFFAGGSDVRSVR